jgi:ribonuclease HII
VEIREKALAFGIAFASVEEIDRLNILQATLLAMRRAVEGLAVVPEGADRRQSLSRHCPCRRAPSSAVTPAEPAISAASILAKTARDAEMRRIHEAYPAVRAGSPQGL